MASRKAKGQIDFYFFITIMALLAIGLIMVFSASSESARTLQGNAYYFIIRQGLWAVISLGAMFFFANFDYHKLGKLAFPILVATILLLVLVLLIGSERNGGKRWIDFGPMTFQPSELAKIAVILFFAYSLSKNPGVLKKFWTGLVPYLAILGLIAGLLIVEPHLSVTIIILLVGVIMLFVAGAQVKHFVLLAAPACAAGVLVVLNNEHALKRVTSFLDPFADKLGDGWQVIQSLYAIGSGRLFGLGLGRSRQKFMYIPEPHNDFIFSILCEELGFVGAALVIALFAALIIRGVMIAMKAPDSFGALTAIGIISLVGLEVIMNIAVVTSSMPVTGIPLPFFSYGGTALLAVMSCMGIMLNISRQASNKLPVETVQSSK